MHIYIKTHWSTIGSYRSINLILERFIVEAIDVTGIATQKRLHLGLHILARIRHLFSDARFDHRVEGGSRPQLFTQVLVLGVLVREGFHKRNSLHRVHQVRPRVILIARVRHTGSCGGVSTPRRRFAIVVVVSAGVAHRWRSGAGREG